MNKSTKITSVTSSTKTVNVTVLEEVTNHGSNVSDDVSNTALKKSKKLIRITYIALLALALLAPMLGLYPVFVMKLLCFALFACAFKIGRAHV